MNSMAYFLLFRVFQDGQRSSGATPSLPVSRSSTRMLMRLRAAGITLYHLPCSSQATAARTTMRSSCISCVV